MAHARSRLNNVPMAAQQVGNSLKELALATPDSGNVGPIQSTGMAWGTASTAMLNTYRVAHSLTTPAAFASNYHQALLTNPGIGRQSPTMARRKDKRRVAKEVLALAVRKNFNSAAVSETDVVVELVYKVRHQAPAGGKERNPANMQQVLDPDPRARERWERRQVIQLVRKGGRLTKQQLIKRTEREHVLRTHNLKTSVKKLGMVARQIAGKTIDDAITQMRFSKKKIAQDVLKQLEYARDEAVVMRGMGLGSVKAEENAGKPSKALTTSTSGISPTTPAPTELQEVTSPVQIQLKDGKRHKVSDPSTIYIDQAWVGRGPFGRLPDYRARGQVNFMRTPWTSLSVVLKEEKTRIRLHEEREEKRKKAVRENVWTHLPDRPVQWQRQWYTF
ncbi:hypothetical protein B0A54_08427 [Friedmanniomyces endolithicus]|uniref:54S ribosomal protein L22, mitochondrial n=1 Tax=Friedmanniomyces endolithicus TaxID=329885 RepID=A0A4U0UUQ5_9PEZI|nr:hypothetical protein B0A54_08427 [Friedmanniomyces endolithicus]